MGREALALQAHRLQAKVDQDLQAVGGGEAVGVFRLGYGGDLPVHRTVDLPLRGNDRQAVSQDLLGEDLVRDLLQGDRLSVHRRQNGPFRAVVDRIHTA